MQIIGFVKHTKTKQLDIELKILFSQYNTVTVNAVFCSIATENIDCTVFTMKYTYVLSQC